jgi:methylmalonyl-CoA mutase N-terminal domain/subunit
VVGDAAAVAARVAALEEIARGQDDLMPAILDAVRAEATLGEVCGALRTAFGDYRPAAAALI